jgi:RND superfamily putative drug exporter
MGRWSAAHWKTATFGWLAIIAIAFYFGNQIGTENIDEATSGPGESGRVDKILDAGFTRPADETVLVQSADGLTLADQEFRAAVDETLVVLAASPDVQNVESPLDPAHADQVSEDGSSVLVDFEIRGDPDDAPDLVDPIVAEVEGIQDAHPELYVGEIGDASAEEAVDSAVGDDLAKAGMLSLPITLIILLIALGALVAAGIPLLIGLTAVLGALGLTAFASQVMPISEYASAVVLLVGLAVGVDYVMFYLRRFREERAAGRGKDAALEAAAATSGRSVLISGLTVIVAMAGMFFTGDATFASFGLATILVVAVAVLGSLTVLPALLSRLGDRVDAGRVPFTSRRREGREGRFWGAVVDRVLRHPVVSIVLAGGLLIALAVPALQLRTAVAGVDSLPDSIPVIDTYDRVQAAFPGSETPATVVVEAADVRSVEAQRAIGELQAQALATGQMHEPIEVDVNDEGTVAAIAIPIDGNGTDDASKAALTTLRDEVVPATVGTLGGAETGVTGPTAQSEDFGDQMRSALPIVFGFVLILAFLLMLYAFSSIVIAVKAIVLNLLSVGAAYGILVLVFQHGWGSGLLGFDSTDGIDPVIPILLFVILFGLSMDYHVFILSRIRELHDRGHSNDEAIRRGITSTAGVVTAAAFVMVGVFAVFATLQFLFFKQFGVGLAAAVLIDATIIRGVLLPATMTLLGERNWYLPRWLRWLPRPPADGLPEPSATARGLS